MSSNGIRGYGISAGVPSGRRFRIPCRTLDGVAGISEDSDWLLISLSTCLMMPAASAVPNSTRLSSGADRIARSICKERWSANRSAASALSNGRVTTRSSGRDAISSLSPKVTSIS